MKRVFLFSLVLIAAAFSANAQQDINRPQTSADVGTAPIQKGNWMIGGSIGSIGYSFESENFNIAISPKAGYFISDGLAVGLQLDGGFQSVKAADDIWNYGISPFVRYYFPRGASASGRFFAHGNIGIAGSQPGDGAAFAFGLNLGYAHFITKSVALELTAGYNYSEAANAYGDKQSGLGAALGFQIYLPGQH